MPFTFLLALGIFSVAILWCVDVDKSRKECRAYLDEEAVRVYGIDPKGAGESAVSSGTDMGVSATRRTEVDAEAEDVKRRV